MSPVTTTLMKSLFLPFDRCYLHVPTNQPDGGLFLFGAAQPGEASSSLLLSVWSSTTLKVFQKEDKSVDISKEKPGGFFLPLSVIRSVFQQFLS